MESSSIENLTHTYCDLTSVGGLLDHKGYCIALRPGSPYRSFFSIKILAYEESEKCEEKVKSKVGIKCDTTEKVIPFASELHVGKIGGVFLVLLAGAGIGCLIVILEFVCKTKNISRKE
ncbi:glutamate receptor ionotropic: kainate 2-like protein, partial [Dinothrombium tinctorium]